MWVRVSERERERARTISNNQMYLCRVYSSTLTLSFYRFFDAANLSLWHALFRCLFLCFSLSLSLSLSCVQQNIPCVGVYECVHKRWKLFSEIAIHLKHNQNVEHCNKRENERTQIVIFWCEMESKNARRKKPIHNKSKKKKWKSVWSERVKEKSFGGYKPTHRRS